MIRRKTPREIVVFLPYDGPTAPDPMFAAKQLAEALGVEHIAFGTDALTGSVEVRLLYDAGILSAARKALTGQGIVFEIEVR